MLAFLSYTLSSFIAILVIVDPFALLPVFLSMTEGYTIEKKRSAALKAVIIAGCILASFALFGTQLFKVFGITLPAFQIAGGLTLAILGFEQLHAQRSMAEEERQEGLSADDIAVFPLAVPLLAGPGAISTVVLYAGSSNMWWQWVGLLMAIALSLLSSLGLLIMAPKLLRVLGRTGLNLLTRLMGVILVAIAVQFVIDGIKGAFQSFLKS